MLPRMLVPMRIATWNLERPKRRQVAKCDQVREWLRRIDADVWVLTEAHESGVTSVRFGSQRVAE